MKPLVILVVLCAFYATSWISNAVAAPSFPVGTGSNETIRGRAFILVGETGQELASLRPTSSGEVRLIFYGSDRRPEILIQNSDTGAEFCIKDHDGTVARVACSSSAASIDIPNKSPRAELKVETSESEASLCVDAAGCPTATVKNRKTGLSGVMRTLIGAGVFMTVEDGGSTIIDYGVIRNGPGWKDPLATYHLIDWRTDRLQESAQIEPHAASRPAAGSRPARK